MPMLDYSHYFSRSELTAWKFYMSTSNVGAGGLTRRYDVPFQQRGLVLDKIASTEP